tara:strand:+ start:609 stop:845 length:237 start_codon:yes stop_codon:yes gene_type:complete
LHIAQAGGFGYIDKVVGNGFIAELSHKICKATVAREAAGEVGAWAAVLAGGVRAFIDVVFAEVSLMAAFIAVAGKALL